MFAPLWSVVLLVVLFVWWGGGRLYKLVCSIEVCCCFAKGGMGFVASGMVCASHLGWVLRKEVFSFLCSTEVCFVLFCWVLFLRLFGLRGRGRVLEIIKDSIHSSIFSWPSDSKNSGAPRWKKTQHVLGTITHQFPKDSLRVHFLTSVLFDGPSLCYKMLDLNR